MREKDDQVSVMLYFPQEQLVQMFSAMLEEPVEHVRGWLKREHTSMTVEDAERLAKVLQKAIEVAHLIRHAQDYSVSVVTADCDCSEVFE